MQCDKCGEAEATEVVTVKESDVTRFVHLCLNCNITLITRLMASHRVVFSYQGRVRDYLCCQEHYEALQGYLGT